MKRLQGQINDRAKGQKTDFEADEIVIELDHGRRITIRRDRVRGTDGVEVEAGLEGENRINSSGFVIRTVNYGCVCLTIEQNKYTQ